jgi:GNAT superfamily N-acetyltransferase
MKWHKATAADADVLATLNARLIQDEGHRNPMTVPELAQRMASWLQAQYEAVLFEEEATVVGYALFRRDPDAIHLRQFFVERECRRRGVGRAAFGLLVREVWPPRSRITLDVLVKNAGGHSFWRALGFRDYAMVMELTSPQLKA